MAAVDETMELEEEEIMDADDDNEGYSDVNVIMPPPKPNIFPLPKSQPRVANHWSDLSQDWNAEETGKVRALDTLYGAGVHQVGTRKNRGFVQYEDEFGDGSKKIEARLDFERRKPIWEMKKMQPKLPMVADEDDAEDEGEIHSDPDPDEGIDNNTSEPEPEDDESAWSKRLKGPRMRMYADEEEANRKRSMEIRKMYGQGDPNTTRPTKLKVRVDFHESGDVDSDEDRPRSRRLSRDETNTGLGRRFLDRGGDEGFGSPGAGRRQHYENETDFRRRNRYTEDLDRVAHRTIDKRGQKPSIKDRLGVRPGERTPVKSRLGTRRFLGRD